MAVKGELLTGGYILGNDVINAYPVRPAFTIDLSKISYTRE